MLVLGSGLGDAGLLGVEVDKSVEGVFVGGIGEADMIGTVVEAVADPESQAPPTLLQSPFFIVTQYIWPVA